MTDELRKIARVLSYDIHPDKLTFSSLYIWKNKEATVEDKRKFVGVFRKLLSAYHLRNEKDSIVNLAYGGKANLRFLKAAYSDSFELICNFVGFDTFLSRKFPGIATLHPLILSALIDLLYFRATLHFPIHNYGHPPIGIEGMEKEYAQELIDKIKNRKDLSDQQNATLALIDAIHSGANPESLNLKAVVRVASPPRLPTPLHFPKESIAAINTDLASRGLQSLPLHWGTYGIELKMPLLNALINEALIRANQKNQLNLEVFGKYYGHQVMQKVGPWATPEVPPAKFRKVFAPLWLREWVFAPELLKEIDRKFLEKLNLNQLPTFVFNKDYSVGQLRQLSTCFELFRLGLFTNANIEKISLMWHDPQNIRFLAGRRDPTENSKDLTCALLDLTAEELNTFLRSDLWIETGPYASNNLYFLTWMAKNREFMDAVRVERLEFFRETLQHLFSECSMTLNSKLDENFYLPLRLNYFELIRRSFLVFGYEGDLGTKLCENFFDEKATILPQIIANDPLLVLASMQSEFGNLTCTSNMISFFHRNGDISSKFSPKGDHHHLMLFYLTWKPIKLLSESVYLNFSYLNWLSRPTHKHFVVKLFSTMANRVKLASYNNEEPLYRKFAMGDWSPVCLEQSGQFIMALPKVFYLIEALAEHKLLDDPEACCRLVDGADVNSLLKLNTKKLKEEVSEILKRNVKRKVENPEAPAANLSLFEGSPNLKKALSSEFYQDKSYLTWLEMPNYRDFTERLLLASGLGSFLESIKLFINNDLFDKPDYCCLLLKKLGFQKLSNFTYREDPFALLDLRPFLSLKFFSKAVTLEVLEITLDHIKRKSIDVFMSEEQYIVEHYELVKELLGESAEDDLMPKQEEQASGPTLKRERSEEKESSEEKFSPQMGQKALKSTPSATSPGLFRPAPQDSRENSSEGPSRDCAK